VNVRLLAYEALRRGGSTPLRSVERVARREGLDARDRALLRRLVGTEARRRGTLRALVQHFARRKIGADLAIHLRLGFVQIFFLDQIPDHAAVSETVSAAMSSLGDRRGRFVNAVLRNALRARAQGTSGDPRRDLPLREVHLTVPVFHDPREHPLLWMEEALSLPAPLAKRWSKRYGEERARELATLALDEPDLSLRVVAAEDDRASIQRELEASGVATVGGAHERILLAPSSATELVVRHSLFEQGRLTVQGETALRSAELLEARPLERVLDLCAAPGGKTAVLAASGARVLACDSSPLRLVRARDTLRRLKLDERVDLVACDGARAIAPESCDAVLVDAPCSNTGVLAKRPEARWRFGRESQRSLGELQTRLLCDAASCVRLGGRLVYATCSIEPEENQRRVRAFLAEDPRFALEAEIEALPGPRGSQGPADGGYAARLRRVARLADIGRERASNER
jgi:16S rRNA (cytosine967-C5)-methyltransferase